MGLRIRLLAPALVAALCGSCAQMDMTRSGFLSSYDQLEEAPDREVRFVPDEVDYFEASAIDWTRYDTVLVEPVEYHQVGDRKRGPNREQRARLASEFTEILRRELSEEHELVDEPGPGTVLVRAAVTDADPSNIWINWLGLILVVPPDMGGISGELELLDAATGERLVAMTATREGTPFLLIECFFTWGHAHHGMKKWARSLARTIETPAAGE